jgi:DNA-binding SARP family transcriptional activator
VSTLEIRLLGPLEVFREGCAAALPASRKSRALFGYLVASGRAWARGHLCDLLWDGPDDPRAALRWSLAKLRPLVDDPESPRLVSNGDRVGFEPRGARVDLDSVRLELGARPAAASLEALETAASLLRGDLLEDLDLPDCYRYHEWWVSEREAVRSLRSQVLRALVDRLSSCPADALAHARAWVSVEPLADEAHTAVVRLLGELGRPREAMDQYESARRALEAELGARPSGALEAARRASLKAPAPTRPPADERGPVVLPQLFGRDTERERLAHHLAEARARRVTPAVLVTGEPGIGKSRLLDEIAVQVQGSGGLVLRGRAFEAEMVRPYGAWIDALRSAPLGAAAESLREDLAPLLPELGAPRPGEGDRSRLFDAVVQLLTRLAAERPVALLLDDIHWFDEASAALLHYAARARLPGMLLGCAARPGELGENPFAERPVRTLVREGLLEELRPSPLDADETGALARSLDPEVDPCRVFDESQGNPLFILEVIRARERGEKDARGSLEGLIGDRIARLDDTRRDLVCWAAALGRAFNPHLLGTLTGLSAAELASALESLERHRFLKVSSQGGAEPQYDFVHDLVRRGAYESLSLPRRRVVHAQIARVLDSEASGDGSEAGDVAHHAALGGDDALATRACLAAASRCIRIFAYADVAALAEQGIAHAEHLRPEVGLPLQMDLQELEVHSDVGRQRTAELEEALARLIARCQDAGLHAQLRKGFYLRSFLHYHGDQFAMAQEDSFKAVEAGRAGDPATTARALASSGRCLALLGRDMGQAEALFAEAEVLARRERLELIDLHWGLGMLAYFDGDLDRAEAELRFTVRLGRPRADHWAECSSLSYLARISFEEGRMEEALERCGDVVLVSQKMGEGGEAAFAGVISALARGEKRRGELEASLQVLRDVDSKSKLAYALNQAARADLAIGKPQEARPRAAEALAAAEVVGERSERAQARALLAECALATGDLEGARGHLSAVRADYDTPRVLSRRSREGLAAADNRLRVLEGA